MRLLQWSSTTNCYARKIDSRNRGEIYFFSVYLAARNSSWWKTIAGAASREPTKHSGSPDRWGLDHDFGWNYPYKGDVDMTLIIQSC